MSRSETTRDRLLHHARTLLWTHGYSNVSLRQIAAAAGVDVALIARYFGSKRGLFEATLDGAFDLPPVTSETALVEMVVALFTTSPCGETAPTVLQLLLMNAHDEQVGGVVRAAHHTGMQSRLDRLLGDPRRAALFMAAVLAMSVAEKSLRLPGIGPHDTHDYAAQLRHMLGAALSFAR